MGICLLKLLVGCLLFLPAIKAQPVAPILSPPPQAHQCLRRALITLLSVTLYTAVILRTHTYRWLMMHYAFLSLSP